MNTNIDQSGLPDVALMEQLANQLFHEPATQSSTALPATSGVGVSPSLLQYTHAIDPKDAGMSALPQYGQEGGVPVSVAGSGASPSVVQHGNNINLKDPQTSFPDQNLQRHSGKGTTPDWKGDGKDAENHLPFEANASYLTDMAGILSAIHQFIPVAQLPLAGLPALPVGMKGVIIFYRIPYRIVLHPLLLIYRALISTW
ncbi:hypothetical protein [Paraflavitalea speifideaquila]|uniref:hypothetical protein n=1 Tax=Paraflavitalea speifideaquila TaxID=3076558 RepID=UPI0028E564F2|nr:hypothetical protein [Paraflavitalea speifideiaquila]